MNTVRQILEAHEKAVKVLIEKHFREYQEVFSKEMELSDFLSQIIIPAFDEAEEENELQEKIKASVREPKGSGGQDE